MTNAVSYKIYSDHKKYTINRQQNKTHFPFYTYFICVTSVFL